MVSILDLGEERIQAYLKATGTTREELEARIKRNHEQSNEPLIGNAEDFPENHLTQPIEFEVKEDD